MDDAKTELLDKLKTASNILVTVSRNPSVDQLSALLGLTLFLNKQGKHAAAVFSGQVPSTIEFLQPEETIEKNTDSLRDFIIALDKNKADKLRYKVEDDVVRIFITPYKTSITKDDFEFSQGDFNVDLVVAIGVTDQEQLDEAIMAHGRILHDATVASINTSANGELGTINWHAPSASSLSELASELVQSLGADLLDEQIATALLTGIVAETDRFSNQKTSPQTMSISSALMTAGANQQLVASKLQGDSGAMNIGSAAPATDQALPDGALDIRHGQDEVAEFELPSPSADALPSDDDMLAVPEEPNNLSAGPKLMTEPPTMGGQLTANSEIEVLDPSTDPLGIPDTEPPQMLSHQPEIPGSEPAAPNLSLPSEPALPAWVPPPEAPVLAQDATTQNPDHTLTEIEEAVMSPHLQTTDVGSARSEVDKALESGPPPEMPQPIQALNSQQLGPELHPSDLSDDPGAPPSAVMPPDAPMDPNAPPPVPPPIPFQFGNPPPPQ